VVLLCRAGKPTLLLALLSCGVGVWLFIPVAALAGINIPYTRYDWHIVFALGGLIFGLGTSANGGCSISTLSRLARGDWHMMATMFGWVVGWYVWILWAGPVAHVIEQGAVSNATIVFAVWFVIVFWSIKHPPESRRLWFAIMAVGLLAGAMFLLEPHWAPSYLVQHLAGTALQGGIVMGPRETQYWVFLGLLAGMLIAALVTRRFVCQRIHIHKLVLHLTAGIAMGVGACMAMGGNDTHVLFGLPAASPAALLAVVGMLVGSYLGLVIRQPLLRLGSHLGLN
jgi:uncharacterized protein